MKKFVCALLAVLLLASVFAGCKDRESVDDRPMEVKETVIESENTRENTTAPVREAEESLGLEFESNRDGTCRVIGIGSCTDKDIVLPVRSPDGEVVTSISDSAFSAVTTIESVTMEGNITRIGKYAFSGCTNLKSASIPDSVVVLGEAAFAGCGSLQSVTLSRNLLAIEDQTFFGCQEMKAITLPNSISYIGFRAFFGCVQLESVAVPENVTEIHCEAFRECSGLKKISISKRVRSIHMKVLAGCRNLAEISVAPENTNFFSVQNCLVNKDTYEVIATGNNFSIPSYAGISGIGNGAIEMEGDTASLTIPKNITYLRSRAVSGCKNVFYEGTIEEWQSVNKSTNWIDISGECWLTCADGTRLDLRNDDFGGK